MTLKIQFVTQCSESLKNKISCSILDQMEDFLRKGCGEPYTVVDTEYGIFYSGQISAEGDTVEVDVAIEKLIVVDGKNEPQLKQRKEGSGNMQKVRISFADNINEEDKQKAKQILEQNIGKIIKETVPGADVDEGIEIVHEDDEKEPRQ